MRNEALQDAKRTREFYRFSPAALWKGEAFDTTLVGDNTNANRAFASNF